MPRPIYLDHNATTPVDPRVLAAMLPYFGEEFGNASSSSHAYGWAADEAVTVAREQVAQLIGATPDQLVFTSGATEALNLAIKGLAGIRHAERRHIVVSATEHRAVLDTCRALRKIGVETSTCPVDKNGLIDPDELESLVRDDTVLVAVIWANNETGVLQPIEEIAYRVRARGIPFLSDATQAVGKIPVAAATADLLVGSSHKFYGPKGAGFLYVHPNLATSRILPLIDGGGQEYGLRGGTVNTPAIVGMGKAAELAASEMTGDATRLGNLRDRLEKRLVAECPDSFVNGSEAPRLPNTTNICFSGAPSAQIMTDLRDVAVSSGSACSSGSGKPSHVLKAMGLSDADAGSSIRIGLGRSTTDKEVNSAATRIVTTVLDVRERLSVLQR